MRSQLINREADAAILILPADNDVIRDLLKVKGIRLMNFENADAYVNRFPALTKVKIPAGAVDFANSIPREDTTLLATEVALVVRPTLDPALVRLLTYAVITNPKSGFDRADDPIMFYRAGQFPHAKDPEFDVSDVAQQVYASRELPFLLRAVAPLNQKFGVPFTMTAFADRYGTTLAIVILPLLAILLPLMRVMPALYDWYVRRRLMYWYRELKALDKGLDSGGAKYGLPALQTEIERIDAAVRKMRVPLYYSHQLYDLRGHVELVRQRLGQRPSVLRVAAE